MMQNKQAYQAGHYNAARIITDMAPQYIHTENANGRTPVEIATSRYLLHICESPPPAPGGYSRPVHQSVVSALLSEFYPEHEDMKKKELVVLGDRGDQMELDAPEGQEEEVGVVWDRMAVEATYHLAVSVEKSVPGKRKLVNLAEANELAKRLTSGKGQRVPEFNGGDILSLW